MSLNYTKLKEHTFRWLSKLMFIVLFGTSAHTLLAQCPDNNVQFGGTVNGTLWNVGVTNTVQSCHFNNEFSLVSLICGATYTFTTCGASYDTQITIYRADNGAFVAYNDDACGLQSSITFVAPATTNYRVLVDRYFCDPTTYGICTNLTGQLVSCAATVAPTNLAFSNLVCNTSVQVSFTPPASCAVSYQVDVASDPAFTTILINNAPIGGSPFTINGLTNNTGTLYVRIRTVYANCGNAARVSANSATLIIPVTPPQPVMALQSLNVCRYQSGVVYSVTPVAGTTYAWNATSITALGATVVQSGGSGEILTVNFNNIAAGTYNIIITPTLTSSGCAGPTRTIAVTVNPSPAPTATAAPNTVCAGAPVTLTSTSVVPGTTFTWTPGPVNGSPATVNPVVTTTYTVTATTPAGCTGTNTVLVTVNPLPTITANPAAPAICNGQSVSVTASGATTYNWMPGGLVGATQNLAPVATTTYTVTGTNGNGCTGSVAVTVTVNPLPVVTAAAAPNPVCANATLNLTSTCATCTGWSWTGPNGFTSTLQNPTIANIPVAGTGVYTVTGTSGLGCTANATVNVTVQAPPPVAINPAAQTICVADPPATFTASGAVSYVWSNGAVTPAISVNPGVTTVYTVTGTDALGCQATATATLTVNPNPATPTVTGSIGLVCPDQRGTAYSVAQTPGMTYNWTVPAGATLVTGQGTNAITVDWTAGGVPTVAGNYTITVNSVLNGCNSVNPLSINVTVQNPPPAQPSVPVGPTPICKGTSGAYSVVNDPTATLYTWSNLPNGSFISSGVGTNAITINWGAAVPGTYTINVTASNSCGVSPLNSIIVDVIDVRPQPSVITPPTDICVGILGTFTVTADPSATSYTWSNTCGWVSNNSTTNSIDYTPAAGGPCVITVVANNACGSSAPRSITVFPKNVPAQPLPVSGVTVVCPNQVESYTVPSVTGVTYTWGALPAGSNYVSGQGTAIVRINWGTALPQTHTLTVTPSNACGNGTVQSLDVTILGIPAVPDAVNGPFSLCQGQSGLFSVNTPVQGVTYVWSVTPSGPSLSPSGSTATVVFTTAGVYTISVHADNQCGSSAEQIMTTTIVAPTTIVTTPTVTTCNPTVSLTATPGGGTWACVSCPGGATIDNFGNVSGLSNPGGVYVFSYTVTNAPCASATAFATVRYDAAVGGTVSAPQTICSGGNGNVSLSGQSGTVIRWERSTDCITYAPIQNVSNTLTFINLTQTTCFRTVVQRGNCPPQNSSSVQITVIPRVTASATPATQNVCVANATVTGTLPPNTTGTWTFVSGPQVPTVVTAGVTGNITGMTVAGTYVFRWTVTNPPCPTVSVDVTVTRVPALTVPNAGNDQTVCADRATLVGNVPVNGTASWSVVSGNPMPTLTNIGQNLAVADGMTTPGTYVFRYTISNPTCGMLTDDVVITRAQAPTVADAGLDQTTCNATATVIANVPPINGTGVWSFVTGPVPAAITQSLNLGNITGMTQAGTYCFRYMILNPPCQPSTDDVCITVTPQPSPAQVGVTTYNICEQTTATLRALRPQVGTGTWSFVSGPNPAPTVVTQGTDGLVTGLTQVGSYIFRWTVTSTGCPGTSSVDVTVNREALITENISAGPNQVLCNVTTTTLNSPTPIPPRSVGQWKYVSGPVPNVTVVTNGTSASVINMDLPGIYVFQWEVRRQTGSCPPVAIGMTVEVKPTPTTANAGPDQTLCATTATLTGNIPQVGTGAWTQVSGPGSTITPNNNVANISGLNQNATYCYRWTIANAPCTPSTDDVCLIVSTVSIGGQVTADNTVCTGTNTGTLTLTGHSGTIIRWESSINNFGTFTPINNTTATFTYTNLTQTTSYRAVLRNGSCPEVISGFATITVKQNPTVANAGADREFCGSIASTTIAGNTPIEGTPTWVFLTGPTQPSMSMNGNLLTVSGVTMPGTYCFQYRIQNAPCAASADDVCITLYATSNGGTVSTPATVCSGINTGTLTLTGNTGAVVRWESSTNNGVNWTPIQQTTTTLGYLNITQTTIYRAVVKNGICPEANSAGVQIKVSGTPSVANAGPDLSFCGNVTSATVTGNVPQNGTGAWTFVAGPIGANPSVVSNNNVADITNMNLDGVYVFRYTITNAPCPPVFDDMAITRFTQTIPGLLSQSATVCSGNNSGTLTLSGNNGSVVRWERSNDNFGSTISLANTTTNLPYSGLTEVTYYRAVVKAGSCAEAVSNVVTINVIQPPSQANGGPNKTICGPDVTLNAVAPGFGVGTWTFVNGGSPVNITQIGTQLNVTGMAQVGTYTFRWTVTNPPCQLTTADVIVSRLPDAPVANGGADVTTCNTTVTLNGSNAGSGVPMWSQVSGPNASLVNSGTQAILTNLATGTYVFRYTITQSPCPPSTDDVIVTVVDKPSAAQVTNQNVIVCDATTATLSALPPQIGTGVWTVVSGGASVSNPNSPNTTVTGINANGTYVFRWSVSSPPCNIVNTVDVVVTRQNGLGVNAFAGADQMVCNQQFALVLGNQPPLGATGQWAFVSGPAPASITTVGNFGSVTQMSLPGVYRFSWTITPTNGCPPSSSIVSVTRVAPPTVASAGPIQTICGNSVSLTGNTPLEGTGTWTFVSVPNGANPNLNIQGTSLTASSLDVSGTYIFRWTIANPPCTPSAVDIPITVFEPTSGGTLQSDATVCSGNNSGTLTLTNFKGTVTRWEVSRDNFGTFTMINNVSPNLPYNNLTQSTCYRAVVKNGSCPEATSNIVCVNVVPPVTPADAGQDQTICADNITLTGNVPMSGMPMWSFVSGPNGANPQLNPLQNAVVVTNLTVAGNYLFRYTIDNAPCGNSSDLVMVTVNGASNAGVAASNTTVCAANNSGFITLSGFTGTVVRWESSNDPQFTPVTNIANTTATQTYGGLTQTTYYRAVVRSGQCNEAVSNVVEVLVRQITQANAGPSQNLCGVMTATVNGNQPVNGTGTWSFVSGPQGATPSVTTNGTQGDITGLTMGGVYTFRWTINNPPCAPSSATTTINVAPLTVGGSVSSPQTVCGGVNTGTLVLSGAVGNVLRWESSTDNLFTNPIIHQNPTVQHTFVNLTQTTWYRAVVQSGTCQQAFSLAVKITVVQPTPPANAGNNQTVCTPTTTLTGNVPMSGTASWTFVTGPTTPAIVSNNNVANVSGMTVAGNYVFRYDITNAPCPNSAANVQVTVLNPVNTGTIAAPATVCAVNNSGALTLSGNGGAVVRWEFSTDGGVNWTPIQNTGNTLTYSGLTQDRSYRVAINGGTCGTIFTAPVMITVNQPAVAGTLMGEATVCSGNNAGQILLTGQSGNIVRWESSVTGGQTWNNLVNNTNTQLYNNLTQTTAFRAVVQNGVCPAVFTTPIVITVTPASNGGMVMNNMTVCTGQNSGTVVLSGHSGTVVRWESSIDGSNWNAIVNVSTSQVFAGLTQTTLYRAVVQTANCPTANSVPAIITVASGTVAGTLSAPQTVCSGNNNGTLNVTGNVGNIIRWEASNDGGQNFTTINNTTPSLAFNNLNQTIVYRVFVQNGSCAGVFTNTVQVTVEGGANAGTINGSTSVCAGNNFGTLSLTGNGGTILRWESSVDGGVNFTSISNTTTTQTYTNLTQTTIYRAVVSSQLCGGQAFSTPATVTVSQPSFAGIIAGGQTACGVNGVSGALTVNSFVGTIVRWEISNDDVNFTSLNQTTPTITYNVNQTTFYRVVVKNGACPEATSASVSVRVFAPSVGGTVTGSATVCDANNGGALTLNNQVGNIIRWEASNDGGQNWTPINSTNNPLFYSGLTQTTMYRAVVQNGTCPTAVSSTATITVLGNLTLNAQGVVGCTSIGSIYGFASGGSGQYTYKITPPVAPDNDNGQFVNLPSGNYTITAVDANGCSISVQLFLPQTQTAPVINPVTSVTQNSAFITWPTVPPGSGVVYTLRYRILGTSTWTTITNITNTFQLLQNLQNNTTYEIQLAYRCSANGPLSQFSEGLVTQFTTQSMGNCTNSNPVPIPGGFFVDQVTNTSFRTNWNRVPDALGYIISWGRTNQDPNVWSQTIVCDPTQSFTISSLTPNTSYGVRIRTNCSNCTTAINNADRRSAWSITNTATTPASRELESLTSNNSNDVQVYPNPNNGFFNVSFDALDEENIVIHLTDVTGRTLLSRNITAKVGNNEVPFELNGYASGVYMLRVVRGGQTQTTKIVVE